MNFCWLLWLWCSKGNPSSCKSDTRITDIHQASQQRKGSGSKKRENKWEQREGKSLATSKEHHPNSSYAVTGALTGKQRKAGLMRLCVLIKHLWGLRKQRIQSVLCSLIIKGTGLIDEALLSHAWQCIYHSLLCSETGWGQLHPVALPTLLK